MFTTACVNIIYRLRNNFCQFKNETEETHVKQKYFYTNTWEWVEMKLSPLSITCSPPKTATFYSWLIAEEGVWHITHSQYNPQYMMRIVSSRDKIQVSIQKPTLKALLSFNTFSRHHGFFVSLFAYAWCQYHHQKQPPL